MIAAVENLVDDLARWTPLLLAVALTLAGLFDAIRERAGRVTRP